jgi:helix-turn-helix protein
VSFVLEAEVIETSPLQGTARTIHILLAHHANKDNKCWPKQETLAKEAGCSARQVRRVLAQMVELGLIEVVQRKRQGNYHQYQMISKPDTMSGSNRTSTSTSNRTSTSASYKEEPPEEPPENLFAPAAREEPNQGEDVGMAWIPTQATNDEWDRTGVSDEAGEDQPQPRRKHLKYEELSPNTSKMCRYAFHKGAVKVGHAEYSIKFLNRVIWELHNGDGKASRPYTYIEIETLIGVFFTRHGQDLRSDTKDIVSAFNWLLPRVQREAKDSLRPTAPQPTQDRDGLRAATMWAKYTQTGRTAANA